MRVVLFFSYVYLAHVTTARRSSSRFCIPRMLPSNISLVGTKSELLRSAVISSARDRLRLPHADVSFPYNRSCRVLALFGANGIWWQNVFASNQAWETETYFVLERFVSNNTIYVDFGSWIGPTLLFAAQKARVSIGLEPDPSSFAELSANVLLNPEFSFKVILLNACVAGTEMAVDMKGACGKSMSTVDGTYSETHPLHRATASTPTWQAYCITLRFLLESYSLLPRKHEEIFIKIDAEGAESHIIPGISDLILQLKPRISVYVSMHDVVTRPTREVSMVDSFLDVFQLFTYATTARDFTLGIRTKSTEVNSTSLCTWCAYILHF